MQRLKDNPMLVAGLLAVALLLLTLSWLLFMRPYGVVEVEPIQLPPSQTNPQQGGYSPL